MNGETMFIFYFQFLRSEFSVHQMGETGETWAAPHFMAERCVPGTEVDTKLTLSD